MVQAVKQRSPLDSAAVIRLKQSRLNARNLYRWTAIAF
jgi:hypothetical protein